MALALVVVLVVGFGGNTTVALIFPESAKRKQSRKMVIGDNALSIGRSSLAVGSVTKTGAVILNLNPNDNEDVTAKEVWLIGTRESEILRADDISETKHVVSAAIAAVEFATLLKAVKKKTTPDNTACWIGDAAIQESPLSINAGIQEHWGPEVESVHMAWD